MKLTEWQVRRWPALAVLTASSETHSYALVTEAYRARYGDELPDNLNLLKERAIAEMDELFDGVEFLRSEIHRARSHSLWDDLCTQPDCDKAFALLGKR